MSFRETILQAVRSWLKAYASSTPLTDAQVVPSEVVGTNLRPDLPYLTVKVLVSDVPIGQDEVLHGASGSDPTSQIRGGRRFTVSVQGFGEDAADWLATACLSLAREDVADTLTAAGLSLVQMAGATNDTDLLDTGFEARSIREFEGQYQLTGDAETLTPLSTVQVTQTQSSDGVSDLDGSFTVNL